MSARPDQVRYSKNDLRKRAAAFARKHADDASEAAEKQMFWQDLLGVFGREVKEVGRFEMAAKRLSTGGRGAMDLLIPAELGVEHKSLGEDLNKAMGQLFDYIDDLQPAAAPWLLVVCDFQNFYWHDLINRTQGKFKLEALPDHIELFWWLAGHREKTEFEDEEAANLVATGYLAELHDAVLSSGYDSHALREWLTRILFCLFADHTEVWERNAFTSYIFLNTRPDGSDLGPSLAYLFQLLNTDPTDRPTNLDEDLAEFTFINGDLFAHVLPIPSCDEATRTALLRACKFDWSVISPAIFGSMFQNVMTPIERRHLGAHYTTEENILKTIGPLFVDDLEQELAAISVTKSPQSRAALNAFHEKISTLNFMDPALGCGNFLVIAYREIRRLETEVLRKLQLASDRKAQAVYDVSHLLKVTVGQFYGIEIEEFPARIARTALYLMDHQANRLFSSEFGEYFARFPIPTSPHIVIHNALVLDWNEIISANNIDYIFGNPPFVGMNNMNADQQADNRLVFVGSDTSQLRTGRLDYVACWYEKAMTYATDPKTRIAFVSTNSITQGEQARSLGPLLDLRGFVIDFAHTTFAWSSEAKGTAHVHCVIIGLSHEPGTKRKRLFEYATLKSKPKERDVKSISIFLDDRVTINPTKRYEPLVEGLPLASKGSQPTDGGHLIIDDRDVDAIRADPIAARYLHRYVQSHDMLHGEDRWCLWLVDATPRELRASSNLHKRIEAVAEWRRTKSKTLSVQRAASTPALFTQRRQPTTRYLAMPEVSSSAREYIPGRFFEPEVIAGNKLIVLPGAKVWLFGLLHSAMWNTWMKAISGRLKSDISFSPGIGYFAFPFPNLDASALENLTIVAQRVLDSREAHPESTLADLYDPLTMPEDLRISHQSLDRVVDDIYGHFARIEHSDTRLALLIERYELLTHGAVVDL
jgi:hypothetical protein